MITILITGFGPFPGAPVNPTGPLVHRLSRLRRPALRDVQLVGHVFATSYAAVDRELPELIARYHPDALLMFGVATRRKQLSIETRARNALALMPDAGRSTLARHVIAPTRSSDLPMPAPCRRLLAAARASRVPVALSRDAGRYLCNYLCWHAAAAPAQMDGPRLAAFVHVPPLSRTKRQKGGKTHKFSAEELARAGEAILVALAAAARR